MFKLNVLCKKVVLTVLILGIGLAALPLTSAYATAHNDSGNPLQPANSRLEKIWTREQVAYHHAGIQLSKAEGFIGKVQSRIDQAKQKGWDVSAVQAALDAFRAALPSVQTAYSNAGAFISLHAGFDGNGKVIDLIQAGETVKSLGKALKDIRSAMNGTGIALHAAIKTFRGAHKPIPTP